MKSGQSIRELVIERGLIDAARLDQILSVEAMTRGGVAGGRRAGRGQVGRVGLGRQVGWSGGLFACLAMSVCLRTTYPTQPTRPSGLSRAGRTKPKLFEPHDLGLLDAPDRDQWQKPEQIMDTLGIADGSVVADLGAGGGWFTLQLARRVGPNGVVYAEDIQPAMLAGHPRRMQVENLTNVRPILGTPSDPRLPTGLDAAIIVDSYHEMDDPRIPPWSSRCSETSRGR